MTECCFGVIKRNKLKLYVGHYGCIKDFLNGVEAPTTVEINYLNFERSDTGYFPAVIIDFSNQILFNSPLNRFDDFKQYLPDNWTYKEIR